MQRALVEQLDMEQQQVMELQRYEGLYKEVMMQADRSEADIAYMQVGGRGYGYDGIRRIIMAWTVVMLEVQKWQRRSSGNLSSQDKIG